MGQTLSEPVTTKHTSSEDDSRIYYASSAMQGWRIGMEDAHTAILSLPTRPGHAFFGVYDGHGGQNVALQCGKRLHEIIANDAAFAKKDYPEAIRNGFLGIDSEIRLDPNFANETSGCTATIVLVTDDGRIFVGNAGDSRTVISQDGTALPLSEDHKPGNEGENERIVQAGGFVEFGRVNGNLALSRAIGDFEFKQNKLLDPDQQIVTANPDIRELKLSESDQFIVLACDGIWDCLTNQEVVTFIRRGVAAKLSLGRICERLMERCLAQDSDIGGVGCDNMTVVIVALLGGRSKEKWYEWVGRGVEPLELVEGDAPRNALESQASSVPGPRASGTGEVL